MSQTWWKKTRVREKGGHITIRTGDPSFFIPPLSPSPLLKVGVPAQWKIHTVKERKTPFCAAQIIIGKHTHVSVLPCSVRVHVVRCGPHERQLLAGVSTTAELHFTLIINCGFAPQATSTESTGFYKAWLKTLKAVLISMSASMPQPESASWFGLGINMRKAARPSLHDDSEWVWLDLWMSVPQNKEQTDRQTSGSVAHQNELDWEPDLIFAKFIFTLFTGN